LRDISARLQTVRGPDLRRAHAEAIAAFFSQCLPQ
jgi:hypothetical protein